MAKAALKYFAWMFACSISCLGQANRPCRIEYADQNQIDYTTRPRVGVDGTVANAESVPIANACIAVFTEKDHRFVVGRLSDVRGRFDLPLLKDGDYRLVVEFEGYGIANMRFRKIPETRADAPLHVHMIGRGIDTTSYIDMRKQTASGIR